MNNLQTSLILNFLPYLCKVSGSEAAFFAEDQKGIRCESGTVPAAVCSTTKDAAFFRHWPQAGKAPLRDESEDLPETAGRRSPRDHGRQPDHKIL